MIDAVFFDMDGTLLPMDAEVFTEAYFSRLAEALAPRGYDKKALIDGVWKGTYAMIRNDGTCTNEARFWQVFFSLFGDRTADLPYFEEFYRTRFQEAKSVCGFAPEARTVVDFLKEKGKTLVLATNPVFPMIAQESRLRWAGLSPEDFAFITSYENSSYCKPNPAYFTEICEKLSIDPERSLMIGNDAREDTAAEEVGMRVFLLTPCLIGRGKDISRYPQGGYRELFAFLQDVIP